MDPTLRRPRSAAGDQGHALHRGRAAVLHGGLQYLDNLILDRLIQGFTAGAVRLEG